MTWTQTNSISWASNSDTHAVNLYYFDTYLSGRSNWTVSAHPSASGFKRTLKRTITNNPITGSSYEMYYWIDWQSTTSSQSTFWNNDATYTTVPGDLGTYVDADRHYTDWGKGASSANLVRFWQSDQNANAFLVTKGKHVLAWDPGIDNILCFEDSNWDGSAYKPRTHIFPAGGATPWYYNGLPDANTVTSPAPRYIVPGYGGNHSNYYPVGSEYIFMNTPYWYSHDSTTGNTESFPISHEGCADIGMHVDESMTSTARTTYEFSNTGSLMYDGTNYYLRVTNSYNLPSIVFDMGTTEPDLS